MIKAGTSFKLLNLILIILLIFYAFPKNMRAQSADYIVGQYDVLSVYFWNHTELSTNAQVYVDGHISYPLIGDVMVAGLTIKEAEAKIREKMSYYFVDPKITVSLAKVTGKRVSVIGKVVKPGDFDYIEGKRLSDYVAQAGGPAVGADLAKTKITRMGQEGPQVFGVDLRKILKDGRKDLDIVMQGGDTVSIPKTWLAELKEWAPLLGIAVSAGTLYLLLKRITK